MIILIQDIEKSQGRFMNIVLDPIWDWDVGMEVGGKGVRVGVIWQSLTFAMTT